MRPTTPFQTGQLELHQSAPLSLLFSASPEVRVHFFLFSPFHLHEVGVQDKALEGALLSVLEDEGPMAGTRLKLVKSINGPLLVVARKPKNEGVFNVLLQKFPREHNRVLVAIAIMLRVDLRLPDFSTT